MKLDDAVQQLKSHSYKTTAKRKDMLAFFAEADGYRTAKDLISYMTPKYAGISYDTIYRNLHLFHEVGVLEATELNGEKHFRFSCSHHHHHHFICKDCGKTKALEVCPMDDIRQSLDGYEIEDHKLEIYGLCPVCQES